jgi:hypothetical protein
MDVSLLPVPMAYITVLLELMDKNPQKQDISQSLIL